MPAINVIFVANLKPYWIVQKVLIIVILCCFYAVNWVTGRASGLQKIFFNNPILSTQPNLG